MPCIPGEERLAPHAWPVDVSIMVKKPYPPETWYRPTIGVELLEPIAAIATIPNANPHRALFKSIFISV